MGYAMPASIDVKGWELKSDLMFIRGIGEVSLTISYIKIF